MSIDLTDRIEAATSLLRRVAGERPVLAFSGGKDSIVTCHLAVQVGIRVAVCEESFCYPQSQSDYREYAARLGIIVDFRTSVDVAWLRKHRNIVFSSDPKVRAFSFAARHQATVRRFAASMKAGCVIFGRRTQENAVRSTLYRTADGVLQCHPLRDWTTDEVWSYMDAAGLSKPWIYSTPMGKIEGNCPFYTIKESDFGGMDACWALTSSYCAAFNKSLIA